MSLVAPLEFDRRRTGCVAAVWLAAQPTTRY
jgi:hypothetical protein